MPYRVGSLCVIRANPPHARRPRRPTPQSWLQETNTGIAHKTWTFGFGHKRSVAQEAGCTGVGTWPWNHACIVMWKTSTDGSHMQTAHTTHFGNDHSKAIAPTAADISKFIKNHASAPVTAPASLEL